MKKIFIKIIFSVAMFFVMFTAFLTLPLLSFTEPFWKRQCDRLICWYDKKVKETR